MQKITKADELSKTANITNNNIGLIKSIFPEVIVENQIDFDLLKSLLGEDIASSSEKYEFCWNGKAQAKLIAQTPSSGTLRPIISLEQASRDGDNLFIEGDNLEVLKCLQKSYHKSINVIFIDPPYNTGNDFIYPDNFHDSVNNYKKITKQIDDSGRTNSTNKETSGRYHSNWLSMMYPRLKLARNLLAIDGVIFISIDDTEVANLRKLCDEIFGEENFVSNVVWQKKYTRSNDAQWFSDNHDHILVYAKSKLDFKLNLLPRNEDQLSAYKNPDHHPKGPWKATPLHAKSGTNTNPYTFKNGVTWQPPKGTFRRFNDESMRSMDEGDEIWFGENGEQTPSRKSFLSDVKNGVTAVTIWPYDEVGHNHEANNELKELGLGGIFNNPKPTRLIERIITLAERNKSSIILDFFAGSGTTAHAVLKKNKEDNGDRRFILVQLPECVDKKSTAYQSGYKYISDFTAARITKVCDIYGSGFKHFKLDDTNIIPWDADFDNLESVLQQATDSIKTDRSAEDVLYEILLKYGVKLTERIEQKNVHGKQVFVIGDGVLIVCLADNITSEVVEGIAQLKQELDPEITHVVFKDAGFADSVVKTNAIQILKQAGIDDVKSI
ncbi:site-specific DNA-methyltransferase [Aeromonas schubertii]|uniref:site-specific DNA-methyltransferase n=1 Tax=Aeromonas schubertii TaxID=652 RepID=UPI001CC73E6C|nr:site-specific DNA-methyltransferase [Aeromonas schubertii]MBZ6071035.1 site-specific DNA-methyltransferase [Aeromonas schubertii]